MKLGRAPTTWRIRIFSSLSLSASYVRGSASRCRVGFGGTLLNVATRRMSLLHAATEGFRQRKLCLSLSNIPQLGLLIEFYRTAHKAPRMLRALPLTSMLSVARSDRKTMTRSVPNRLPFTELAR